MKRAVIRKWAVMALLGVVLMAAGPHPDLIAAESPDDYRVISDKFTISLGSYITDFTTDAAVGSGNVLGTFIRVEDDLVLYEAIRQTDFSLDKHLGQFTAEMAAGEEGA